MNIKTTKYSLIALITFILIFLMNYVGNPEPDKLSRALLTAAAGVLGLTIGLWWMNRNKKDQDDTVDFD